MSGNPVEKWSKPAASSAAFTVDASNANTNVNSNIINAVARLSVFRGNIFMVVYRLAANVYFSEIFGVVALYALPAKLPVMNIIASVAGDAICRGVEFSV